MLKPGYTFGGWLPVAVNKNLGLNGPINDLMHQALVESMKSVGISNPNPPVGCVVKWDNKTVRGHTQQYRSFHAETMAFKEVHDLEKLLEVFVTLEPCSHFGNQPPCVDHFKNRKFSKVHIGTLDPNPKVSGEGIKVLQDLNIPTQHGYLEKEIRAWLFPFLFQQIYKKPLVIGKWAQSSEGVLADSKGQSKWISGEASRSYTHWLRKKYDLIVVGANTFLADHPELTARNCFQPNGAQPLRVVFDPRGKISEKDFANLDPKHPWILITPNSFSKSEGLKCLKWSKDDFSGVRLIELLGSSEISKIINRPVQSIFVEGGPKLLSMLLNEKCIDLIHVFKSKKSMGQSDYKVTGWERFVQIQTMELENDILIEMVSQNGLEVLNS